MPIARIVAIYKEGGHAYKEYKIVLVCKINEDGRISDGEWFGCVKSNAVIYPFVLQNGDRFLYGYEENTFEPTNIGSRTIAEGEYFTVISAPNTNEESEGVYQITSVHRYEG